MQSWHARQAAAMQSPSFPIRKHKPHTSVLATKKEPSSTSFWLSVEVTLLPRKGQSLIQSPLCGHLSQWGLKKTV